MSISRSAQDVPVPPQKDSPDLEVTDSYRPSPDEPYMNPRQLAYFRRKLLTWREILLKEAQQTLDHLKEEGSFRNVGDMADLATEESESILELRTQERYRKLIPKIDAALQRIEDGTYGYCEETGEEIGIKRLEARPIATLCIEAQEWREQMKRQFREDEY